MCREIAADVGTKRELRCQRHYLSVYLESASAPVPDPRATLLEYTGKSTFELGEGQDLPAGVQASAPVVSMLQEQPYLRAIVASVPQHWVTPPPDAPRFILDTVRAGTLDGGEAGVYLSPDDPSLRGGDLVDDDAANSCDMAGYSPLRGDFDVEHANDAEQVIADIEFSPGESPASVELKLKALEIYNAQLDERARRKAFLVQRGLLNYRKALATERRRPRAEREVRAQLRPFMRFMSPGEGEELIAGILLEERLRQRIATLQTARANGVRTLAELDEFALAKKRREESSAIRAQQERMGALYAGVPASTAALGGEDESLAGGASFDSAHSSVASGGGRGGRGRRRGGGRGGGRASFSRALGSSAAGGALPAEVAVPERKFESVPATVAAALSTAPGNKTLSPDEQRLCSHLQLLPSQYHAIRDAVLLAARQSGGKPKQQGEAAAAKQGVPPPLTGVVLDFCVSCGWVDSGIMYEEGTAVQHAPPSTSQNSSAEKVTTEGAPSEA